MASVNSVSASTPAKAPVAASSDSAWRWGDVVSSIGFALLSSQAVALMTSSASPSLAAAQFSGISFLIFAGAYRASLSAWWGLFAPLALICLFAPIARWEAQGLLDFASVLRFAFVPGLSFIAGSAHAISRGTTSGAFGATLGLRQMQARHDLALKDLKALETDMEDVLSAMKEINARNESYETMNASFGAPAWEAPEFAVSERNLAAHAEPVDAVTHAEICQLVKGEVERLRVENKKGLHVSFSAPLDIPFPLAVRARREVLQTAVRAVLAQSIAALGGGAQGVVRVTLRPGLRSVTLSFEDNGRGLHEDAIHSLESKGLSPSREGSMKLADLRRLAFAAGWKMELATRLGVGSRITLELSRVDAFAYGARGSRGAEAKSSSGVDQDSRHA